MKTNALVIMPLNELQREKFSQFQNDINFEFLMDCNVTRSQISAAEIIIGNPPADLLCYAENLKWLQLVTAGADMYLKRNILGQDIIVTNASGAYGEAQSEFMLALLLSLYKKLHYYRDNQNNCFWNDEGDERVVAGSTALVLGLGDIGTQFTKKLKALGAYVIGVRRSSNKKSEHADEVYSFHELGKIIHRADIISMSLPSSPQTLNLMNREMISKIKTGAVLINAGRGSTLDVDALGDALENKKLFGAALDVFDDEPLEKNNKFWKLKNVIITPHVAGHDFLPCTFNKTLLIIINNIRAYLVGAPLENVVNRNIYEFKV